MDWTHFLLIFFGIALMVVFSVTGFFSCCNSAVKLYQALTEDKLRKRIKELEKKETYPYYLEREQGLRDIHQEQLKKLEEKHKEEIEYQQVLLDINEKALKLDLNKQFEADTRDLGLLPVYKIDPLANSRFNDKGTVIYNGKEHYLFAYEVSPILGRDWIIIPERTLFGNSLVLKNSLNVNPNKTT
jgi:hypothetical protein